MPHSALTPVFIGLRASLHVLVVGLAGLVVVRAVTMLPGAATRGAGILAIVLAVLFLLTYSVGGLTVRSPGRRLLGRLWLLLVTLEWAALVWLVPDAAYLVFPLFFLYLHILGGRRGVGAVAVTVAVSVVALAAHNGWSVAGIIGPLVGAGVAVVIGLGYRSLSREATEREALVGELIATRGQLAAAEREAGVLSERARLAREIHDTVAQGLSSIQMLLYAAERADDPRTRTEHIRLASQTAAGSLADARRFIRELTPANLSEHGLSGALGRLAGTQWKRDGLRVEVRVEEDGFPMEVQTALLRIAQGAMANVVRHSGATAASIEIDRIDGRAWLTVRDDGSGFDVAEAGIRRESGAGDSFGLVAMRERVDQLGGRISVESGIGAGTTVRVELEIPGGRP